MDIYKAKVVTAEEAMSHINSGDRIVVAHGVGNPIPLLEALVEKKDSFVNVEICHMLTFGDVPYAKPELDKHFHCNIIFVGPQTRDVINSGIADFTPTHFSEVPHIFKTTMKPDVAFVQVSKPDENGYVSFGLSVDYTMPAAKEASIIIAEVNAQYPRTYGDTLMHVSEIDYFVETDRKIPETFPAVLTDKERKIGGYCAELIKDGDTLQLGLGAIPDAVLASLIDKKDLGVHSEILGDPIVDLIDAGIINGSKKSIHVGKAVATSIFGTNALHRYVNNNPKFELYPVDYVNDVRTISKNKNMVSINSCVQIDFMGQVCSEAIGPYQISAIGGQQDFIRGAKLSEGGRSILAFYSSAKKDSVSRIVRSLDEGAPISGSRMDVDYVVTEYGIAHLRGETLKNRAKNLISVAHPKFRDELMEEFERMFFIKK